MKANVEKARSETVAKLWRVTEQMNILYPENWTRIAAEEILWFQDQLTKGNLSKGIDNKTVIQ